MGALVKSGNIDDLLASLDRAAFGVACRRIEILLAHGENEKALHVFRGMVSRQSPTRPTMLSLVADVLPYRLAAALDGEGYINLAACDKAADDELVAISDVGSTSVEMIRETIRCVKTGKVPPFMDDLSELAPDWSPPSVHVCSCSVVPQSLGEKTVSSVKEALEVLLKAGESGVAEIDEQIAAKTRELDELKRMRKLLAPAGSGGLSKTQPEAFGELERQIVELLAKTGPMKASRIGEKVKTSYSLVGRVAAASTKIFRDENGNIALVG